MVEDPIALELVNTPLRREVKWVSPSGTSRTHGMTGTAKLWEDIEKVLAGDVSPLENLSLRALILLELVKFTHTRTFGTKFRLAM